MLPGSTIHLPHLEAYPIHVSLFRDVKNAVFLRQQLLEGNAEFEYAFLDAITIVSVNHALAAVFRAINDMTQNRLKTRNVHSETVFSLSPNNNIAESFRRFGLSDATSTLLAVKVSNTPNESVDQLEPSAHLGNIVEGSRIDFNDANLRETVDVARVRKIYKLNSRSNPTGRKGALSNGVHDEIDESKEIEAVILGIMTLKGS